MIRRGTASRGRAVRRTVREIALTAGAVFGVVCVVMAVGALVFGVTPLIFRSGSMSPDVKTGALGVAISTSADDLEVGDIVSVKNDEKQRVTHRIMSLRRLDDGEAVLVLKGDANPTPDGQKYRVREADRLLFSVNGLGYAVAALQSRTAVFAGGLAVGILLMVVFRRTGERPENSESGGAEGARMTPLRRLRLRRRRDAARHHYGVAGAAVAMCLLIPSGAAHVDATRAGYTDAAAAAGPIAADTVATPTGTCKFKGSLLAGSKFILTWRFPPEQGYTAPKNIEFERSKTKGLGGVLEPIDAPSITTTGPDGAGRYTTKISTSVLGGLLGGEFRIGMTVKDSDWASRTVTVDAHVNLAGLSGSCTSPFG